jgi:hypothetical protein
MARMLIGLLAAVLCAPAVAVAQTPPGTSDIPEYQQDLPVSGTVPATLTLALAAPATFADFQPGVTQDYIAQTSATVVSTAGDAQLGVDDPDTVAPGHLVNGDFTLPQPVQAQASSAAGAGGAYAPVGPASAPTRLLTYAGPVSNDLVTLDFKQTVNAGDALRTGTYSKTLTFTLVTDQP